MRRFQNCLAQPTEESAPKTSPSVELCIDTRVPIKRDLFMVIVIQKIVYFDQGHEGRDTRQRAKTCAMITVAGRRLGFHGNSPQGLVRSLVCASARGRQKLALTVKRMQKLKRLIDYLLTGEFRGHEFRSYSILQECWVSMDI